MKSYRQYLFENGFDFGDETLGTNFSPGMWESLKWLKNHFGNSPFAVQTLIQPQAAHHVSAQIRSALPDVTADDINTAIQQFIKSSKQNGPDPQDVGAQLPPGGSGIGGENTYFSPEQGNPFKTSPAGDFY